MNKRNIIFGVMVTITGFLLPASASAQTTVAYDGYDLFQRSCFLCHGADGKGHGPLSSKLKFRAADLTDDTRLGKVSEGDLYRIIKGTAPHGTVSVNMPRWGAALEEPQIRSLVAYIRFLHSTKYPLLGNPEVGKKVYNRNCVACHGDDGNGHGLLTNLVDVEPSDHTDAAQIGQLSNDAMIAVISNGSEGVTMMPAWKDLLTKEEIEAVSGYIRLLSAR